MIRSFFGIERQPFSTIALLAHQQEVLDILLVHCRQGGLCLLLGEPGTGKSVVKEALRAHDPKRLVVATVSRSLHGWPDILRLMGQALGLDLDGGTFKGEKRVIEEAFRLQSQSRALAIVVDDAQYLPIQCLRKLRLLLEDFPPGHNLVLAGSPDLLRTISLLVNDDIRSRVTYSTILPRLAPDKAAEFVLGQLDRAGLGHNTFTQDALALVARSSEGVLRRARNLALSALLEAAREGTRTVDLKQVNRVLVQPHWRNDHDMDSR